MPLKAENSAKAKRWHGKLKIKECKRLSSPVSFKHRGSVLGFRRCCYFIGLFYSLRKVVQSRFAIFPFIGDKEPALGVEANTFRLGVYFFL